MGFMPTIARQLGYSKTTYGTMIMVIGITAMIMAPTIGMVVDKFRVKKIIFLTCLMLMGLVSYLLNFVPKAPLNAIVELKCDTETVFIIENVISPQSSTERKIFFGRFADEIIACKVS